MKHHYLPVAGLAAGFFLAMLVGACAPPAAPIPTPSPKLASSPAATPKPQAEAPKPQAEAPKPATVAPAKVQPLSPPAKVKIGITAGLGGGSFFIAESRGYFKELGIDVESVASETGPRLLPSIASGQLDVGSGSPSAGLFNAVARDLDIKVVAGVALGTAERSSNVLAVRKDLIDGGVIKDYADLKGKNIALAAKDGGGAVELDRALAKGKLKMSDVNIIVLPYGDMVIAFANKSIDAAIQIEPLATAAEDKGLMVGWKKSGEFYPNHQYSVWMYSPQFIANKPEAAKRFMVALIRGARDLDAALSRNKDRDAVFLILAKTSNLDPAVVSKTRFASYNVDGYTNLESLSYDQDWYAEQGFVPQKVDMSKLVDNQFADYAIGVLGKYQP